MVRRRTLFFPLLFLLVMPLPSFAQDSKVEGFILKEGTRVVSGYAGFADIPGTNGTERVCMKLAITGTVAMGSGWSWEIVTMQTHVWENNAFVPITPRGVVSSVIGTTGTHSQNTFELFLATPQNQSDATRRSGKYITYVYLKGTPSSTIYQVYEGHWQSTSDLNLWDGKLDKKKFSDLDEEEAKGFWENLFKDLFVPSQESIDDFMDSVQCLTNWGPLGLFNQVANAVNDSASQVGHTWDSNVRLIPNAPRQMTVDASSQSTFLTMLRGLLGGLVWVGALALGWKIAVKMMV